MRTSHIARAVNPRILDRIMEWAKEFDDFEQHHAVDGLYVAAGCNDEAAHISEDDLFLSALCVAFWVWFDDRSDKYLSDERTPVDWNTLIDVAEGKLLPSHPTTSDVG